MKHRIVDFLWINIENIKDNIVKQEILKNVSKDLHF